METHYDNVSDDPVAKVSKILSMLYDDKGQQSSSSSSGWLSYFLVYS